MTGPKNIDRSLKRMARKNAREARMALKNIRANKEARGSNAVLMELKLCQIHVGYLESLLSEKCRYCNEKVEFGNNTCAACADERGP